MDGSHTKDGRHALNMLWCPVHASIMGNFETFGRALFAELFELTELMPNARFDGCIKRLKVSLCSGSFGTRSCTQPAR